MKLYLFAVLFGVSLASSVKAQEPQAPTDWEMARSEDGKMVAATANFTNGVTLIARCQNGVYDLAVAGILPAPAREMTRQMIFLTDGSDREAESSWTVGTSPDVAFSRSPAPFARRLAKGGKLQIIIPAQTGGRRTRYVMELSPSGEALEETLTACNRPLQDPRDRRLVGDGGVALPPGASWIKRPQPQLPDPVRGRWPSEGYVTVSCAANVDGRLSDCQIEAEHPTGFNLSQSVLRSLRNARVGYEDARFPDNDLILFSVIFQIEDQR